MARWDSKCALLPSGSPGSMVGVVPQSRVMTLLYDGNCSFCVRGALSLQRRFGAARLVVRDFQDPSVNERYLGANAARDERDADYHARGLRVHRLRGVRQAFRHGPRPALDSRRLSSCRGCARSWTRYTGWALGTGTAGSGDSARLALVHAASLTSDGVPARDPDWIEARREGAANPATPPARPGRVARRAGNPRGCARRTSVPPSHRNAPQGLGPLRWLACGTDLGLPRRSIALNAIVAHTDPLGTSDRCATVPRDRVHSWPSTVTASTKRVILPGHPCGLRPDPSVPGVSRSWRRSSAFRRAAEWSLPQRFERAATRCLDRRGLRGAVRRVRGELDRRTGRGIEPRRDAGRGVRFRDRFRERRPRSGTPCRSMPASTSTRRGRRHLTFSGTICHVVWPLAEGQSADTVMRPRERPRGQCLRSHRVQLRGWHRAR